MNKILIAFFLFLGISAIAKTQAPHPLIRSITVSNQPLDFSSLDTMELESPRELVFLFREVGGDTTIRYQMVPYNKKRRRARSPVVVYSTLNKGEYIFKSWLKKGDWEQEFPPIHFNAQGPIIGNWWFVPLLVFYLLLLLGGAMYFIFLSNFRSKQKLSDLRSDWTNKLHNDIGGDLSSVSLRLNTLKRRAQDLDPRIQESVLKTYTILESIQRKLRFVFDLVDPKKNSLDIMFADVESFARENYALKGIKFDYQNHLLPELDFSIDVGRINKLYLTMKEAINNSFKYSEATEASLNIRQIKDGLQIKIKDNGIGFDPNAPHNGNGIANLKQYSQEGFIDIEFDTAPGKGTAVTMMVPDL